MRRTGPLTIIAGEGGRLELEREPPVDRLVSGKERYGGLVGPSGTGGELDCECEDNRKPFHTHGDPYFRAVYSAKPFMGINPQLQGISCLTPSLLTMTMSSDGAML
jgi:hypothetical protein